MDDKKKFCTFDAAPQKHVSKTLKVVNLKMLSANREWKECLSACGGELEIELKKNICMTFFYIS